MRRLFLVIFILASAFLSMTLAEAALTASAAVATGLPSLLLLGGGLVVFGIYGRNRMKEENKSIIQFVKRYGTGG